MSEWSTYYQKHASRMPRELLVRAVSFCEEKGFALDLGAGTLVESAFLLESGFKKVLAVDSSLETKIFAEALDPNRFNLVASSFQEFDFGESVYDLVSAQFALPFYGPKDFQSFIQKIEKSLRPGGVFVGQFFGERDGWNIRDKNIAFQTENEARGLLSNFEIIEFLEEEKEGKTASGSDKHWHVFHFIVRK